MSKIMLSFRPFTQPPPPAQGTWGSKRSFGGSVKEGIAQTPSSKRSSAKTSTQIAAVGAVMPRSNSVPKKSTSPKCSKPKTPKRETRYVSSMEENVAAAPRYEISSTDGSICQASADCWDDLGPLPQNGPRAEDRNDNAWLPFLRRLGLQPNTYPSIEVQGKVARPGRRSGVSLRPDWNFIAYTLVALSPKGKLMQREIYNLSLAWCKSMPANNATCRHSLSEMNKSKNGAASLVLEQNCYRLRNAGESSPSAMDGSATSSPSPGRVSAELTSSAAFTEGPEQTTVSGDADEERRTRGTADRKRKRSEPKGMEEPTASMQDESRADAQTDTNRKRPRIPRSRQEAQANNKNVSPNASSQAEINTAVSNEVESDTVEGIDQTVREKIKHLYNLERFVDLAIQHGQGRDKSTFGIDQHPFEIRERARYELECYLAKGGELLKIPELIAYQARNSNSRLPNGRTLLPRFKL